ncbi:Armadillo repeat-containing protein 8 [Chytriomyces hyalinus]|nr:Armadillo repeat-containing protein 8 [Chytriomyces hyalinus]
MRDKHEHKLRALVDDLRQATRNEADAAVVDALRALRNSAIGGTDRKCFFLATVDLAEILLSCLKAGSSHVRILSAVVLASLFKGVSNNFAAVGAAPLFTSPQMLASIIENASVLTDLQLVESSLRALKAILTVNIRIPGDQTMFISNLISLLSPPTMSCPEAASSSSVQVNIRINELSAAILAHIASSAIPPTPSPTTAYSQTSKESQGIQSQIVSLGALQKLLNLLSKTHWVRFHTMQEHALDALSCLVKGNAEAGKKLVSLFVEGEAGVKEERSVLMLLRLLKEGRFAMTRLLAASCLSNLYRIVNLENQRIPSQLLLPTLIKLFSDVSLLTTDLPLLERAPLVFAELVADSEMLQKLAMEGDAITKLSDLLQCHEMRGLIGGSTNGLAGEGVSEASKGMGKPKSDSLVASVIPVDSVPSLKTYEHVVESCLLAIASVSSLREDCRKQVIDAKLLPLIVSALSSPSTRLRSAACKCTRSLSRSVKNLRTSLVDAGVAYPLFNLLNDKDVEVQTSASATLCNIVLDFSPMKKTVIEHGGVERIVALVSASDYHLKLNSVWALKNLLYQAGSTIKAKVMAELGWEGLKRLLFDTQIGIQEQSLNLLRNLVCGKEEDIDAVFDGLGEASLAILFDKKLSGSTVNSSEFDAVILQTLYVIVNIATGGERHKGLIAGSDSVLSNIFKFMSHDKSLIRLATVWCVINLTDPDEAAVKGTHERCEKLLAFGFHEQLKQMLLDSDPDVRERVKTAIKNLVTGVNSSALGASVNIGGLDYHGDDDMDHDGRADGGDDVMELEGMQDLSSYLSSGRG